MLEMLPERFQKRLDKQRQAWYNTRRKVVKMKSHQNLVELKESVNPIRSQETDQNIRDIGTAIVEAQKKSFGGIRTPVIAGGAIRDFVYGLNPNDYDIFFDVSSIDKEEQDDAVMLFGLRILDELTALFGDRYSALKDNTLVQRGVGDYAHAMFRHAECVDPRWKDFIVYETADGSEEAWQRFEELHRIDPEEANKLQFIKLQFIGHNDSRLSQENVLPFVEYFDYSMCRGLYDPRTEEYLLHDDFVASANSKIIEVDNQRSLQRANEWNGRFRYATPGVYKETLPFTVKDTRPKPEKTTRLDLETSAVYRSGLTNPVAVAAYNLAAIERWQGAADILRADEALRLDRPF
jgi:hypothetical protein